jgi:hypothetical protein
MVNQKKRKCPPNCTEIYPDQILAAILRRSGRVLCDFLTFRQTEEQDPMSLVGLDCVKTQRGVTAIE